jgi:hypothetical protein
MIFNDNRRAWLCDLSLFNAMLVPVNDKQVMTQQTVAPNFYVLACRNRCTIVNERMVSDRDTRTTVSDEFDRDDGPDQANAIPKFEISVNPQTNAAIKSHRQRYPGLTSNAELSVEKCRC